MRCPPPGVGQELLLLAMPSNHSQNGRQTVWQVTEVGFMQSLLLQAWGLGPEGVWVVRPPPPLLSLEL